MKLTDTQLVLLSAASRRDDGGVVLSDKLKGGAARKVLGRLLDTGLVEEVQKTGALSEWRRDVEDRPIALVITEAGLKAIGVEPEEAERDPAQSRPQPQSRTQRATPQSATPRSKAGKGQGGRLRRAGRQRPLPTRGKTVEGARSAASSPEKSNDAEKGRADPDGAATLPRAGSKTARLIALLQKPKGSSIDDIVTALGWLPHTTRAAITGLRKRGFAVERTRSGDGKATYRITEGPADAVDAGSGSGPVPAPARASAARPGGRRGR